MRRLGAVVVMALLLGRPAWAAAAGGYEESVAVSAAGRLDWTFVAGTQSLAEAPADWTSDYQSTAQHYARFIPPSYDARQAYPLIVFISSSKSPAGWKEWEPICRREGLLFASPHEAGNECPLRRRVRIVLDVLDDVCRHDHVDPDRIYLGGISGGARAACTIAFALPEYFGGLVPVCAGGEVRPQRWLWHRAAERLSTAFITGENDFNRAEVERYWTPILQSADIRTRTWVAPKMGHAMPGPDTLGEAFAWLEADLPRRREAAQRWPAQRIDPARPLDRQAWSEALLSEGRQRLGQESLQFSGLMQIKGVLNRWPDLPAAHEAKKILTDYSQRSEHPWAKTDLAQQRQYRIAVARAAADFATGPLLPPYDAQRAKYLEQAQEKWRDVLNHQPDTALRREASKRLAELKKAQHGG